MTNKEITIDLAKFSRYLLKRIWFPVLLAAFAFSFIYWRTAYHTPKRYTASGTMYVYNANPNLVNYQYTSVSDLESAVQLIDTYMIVVRSNKVLDVIVERLSGKYPGIQPEFIASCLSMASVSQTGVVSVNASTGDPELSADICNAVLDVAPSEIVRVVGAGNIEIIDYAMTPKYPDRTGARRKAVFAGFGGGAAGCLLLLVLFLINQKITYTEDLTDNYTPPILSLIPRQKRNNSAAGFFLLSMDSSMDMVESYARLRLNLLYTMVEKESHAVVVTSAVPGEGKSTIAANLAISCAWGGKKVLLVDSDLRRAFQREIFGCDRHIRGLSEAILGQCSWRSAVLKNVNVTMDLLPSGHFPPNPTELLESEAMTRILKEMEQAYDLVILDMPPVNLVTDPLVLSSHVAGSVFVVRQNFSSHKEIRTSLNAAQMTGMPILGFVFYGENVDQGGYYNKKYQSYYHKSDHRKKRDGSKKRIAGNRIGQMMTRWKRLGRNQGAAKK